MLKEIVNKAYNFSKEAHKGQFRKFTNLPYFTHPKGVARYIEQLTKDPEMIAAALLHDVVEDSNHTIEEIRTEFGERVASLVDEVTNKEEERVGRKKKEYLKDKMVHMSDDALIIKLADRLQNVLFLEKDAKTDEHKKFIFYYYKSTRYILDNLKNTCWAINKKFNRKHKVLYKRIVAILDFLEVRYGIPR